MPAKSLVCCLGSVPSAQAARHFPGTCTGSIASTMPVWVQWRSWLHCCSRCCVSDSATRLSGSKSSWHYMHLKQHACFLETQSGVVFVRHAFCFVIIGPGRSLDG